MSRVCVQADYWFRTVACALFGMAPEELHVHTGGTNSGKSLLMEKFLSKALGGDDDGLLITVNPETIACAKEVGINVELAKMARSRIVISAEPDKRKQWSAAQIKKIAGKGKVTGGRGLYSDNTNFHRTFVAFVLCNDMPGIADNDAAVTDRFRVLKYPCTFSSPAEGHAPPGERAANSRVADPGIVRRIKTEHAPGLLKKFTLMCATNHGGAPAVLPCGFRDHIPMPTSVESDSKVKANGWATELQDETGGER